MRESTSSMVRCGRRGVMLTTRVVMMPMVMVLVVLPALLPFMTLPPPRTKATTKKEDGSVGRGTPTSSAAVLVSAFTMSMRRVAVVTGATRGIGRGVALELGSMGYVVYAVGRSSRGIQANGEEGQRLRHEQRAVKPGTEDSLTVEAVAEEVTARGGVGIPFRCDLRNDDDIVRLFQTVRKGSGDGDGDGGANTGGRLHVLVCSAYSVPSTQKLRDNFWNQSMELWDDIHNVGLRQVYATCREAVPLMIDTAASDRKTSGGSGMATTPPLIALISSFGGKSYTFNVAYGVGKAAVDRLATDMAIQLRPYGVATTALYPGLVRTEANLQMEVDGTWEEASGGLDLTSSCSESPAFTGRALKGLLRDLEPTELMNRSGQVQVVAELATELGFTDVDGTTPPSIRSLQYLLPNFLFPKLEQQWGKTLPEFVTNNVPDVLLPWSVFSSGPPPEQ